MMLDLRLALSAKVREDATMYNDAIDDGVAQ